MFWLLEFDNGQYHQLHRLKRWHTCICSRVYMFNYSWWDWKLEGFFLYDQGVWYFVDAKYISTWKLYMHIICISLHFMRYLYAHVYWALDWVHVIIMKKCDIQCRRIREKYEMEMRDLERSEQQALEKYNEMKVRIWF